MKILSGPCVIEDEGLVLEVASELKRVTDQLEGVDYYFKASFDKANRSSVDSYRGPGLEKGLKILAKAKSKLGVKIVTDFHLPEQAAFVAEVADCLQIPAFLCRQTDMIEAAVKMADQHDCVVNIKKGQFLSPWECQNIVDKVRAFENKHTTQPISLCLTERGTTFGYQRLVVDMTSYPTLRNMGVTVIHDATHCVQSPGGAGKTTGGFREFIKPLMMAAIAAGAEGVFMETHPNPDKALSDGPNSVPLGQAEELLKQAYVMRSFVGTTSKNSA